MTFNAPCAICFVEAKCWNADRATVEKPWISRDSNEAAPCAGAYDGAEFVRLEQPREHVAAGTCEPVDEHRHWSTMSIWWPCVIARVTTSPEVRHRSIEQLDEARWNLSATIPAFIDEKRRFHALTVELPHEFSLPIRASIRNIDVADLAAGKFVDHASLTLDPIAIVQIVFACDSGDDDVLRIRVEHGFLRDGENHSFSCETDKRCPWIDAWIDRDTVHRK